MTDAARVAEIRERLEAATPGPWVARCRDSANTHDDPSFEGYGFLGWEIDPLEVPDRGMVTRGRDADFIAHAPEDLRYLLSLVAQQAQRIADLEQQVTQKEGT